MGVSIGGIDIVSQGLNNELRIEVLERVIDLVIQKSPNVSLTTEELENIRNESLEKLNENGLKVNADLKIKMEQIVTGRNNIENIGILNDIASFFVGCFILTFSIFLQLLISEFFIHKTPLDKVGVHLAYLSIFTIIFGVLTLVCKTSVKKTIDRLEEQSSLTLSN